MIKKKFDKITIFSSLFIFLLFVCAFLAIDLSIKTTIIGYKIGSLKTLESKLTREKSRLTVKLAKISQKDFLIEKLQQENN